MQAQIPAEVCYVEEKGVAKKAKGKGRAKKTMIGSKRKRDESDEDNFDENLLESEDDAVPNHLLLDSVVAETLSPVLPLHPVLPPFPATPSRMPPYPDSDAPAVQDQEVRHQLLTPSNTRSPSTPRRRRNIVEVVITSPSPRKRIRQISPEI